MVFLIDEPDAWIASQANSAYNLGVQLSEQHQVLPATNNTLTVIPTHNSDPF